MSKIAIFSMDVEEWYDSSCLLNVKLDQSLSTLDGIETYLNLLDKYNIKSTLFTLSSVTTQAKDILLKASHNGHEIALHGKFHVVPMLKSINDFEDDIRCAKKEIEETLNISIEGYRAPCFSIDQERIEILRKSGFRFDSSSLDIVSQNHHTKLTMIGENIHGIIRDDGFYEFPIATGKILGKKMPISGGGYLRLIPWWAYHRALSRYMKENDIYIFYVHPFELSTKVLPRIKEISLLENSYFKRGRKTYSSKIERLIRMLQKNGFEFRTFSQMVNELDQ